MDATPLTSGLLTGEVLPPITAAEIEAQIGAFREKLPPPPLVISRTLFNRLAEPQTPGDQALADAFAAAGFAVRHANPLPRIYR